MGRPRHKAHPDANQQEIVDGLRACGYLVIDCSQWASEFDLAVCGYDEWIRCRRWQLFEIKTRTGRLTLAQEAFQREHPDTIPIVLSLEEILEFFGRQTL